MATPSSAIFNTAPSALLKEDITQHEIEALKTRFNLADAHTHQAQSETQKNIVSNLPNIWYEAENHTQHQSEQHFIEQFYRFHGQHTALKRKDDIYLVYAASIAMHITATYLRQHEYSVGLIEPCFDNLHDLMKHMQVPMSPLDESLFADSSKVYENLTQHAANLDAICIVDPNNPSGFTLFSGGNEPFHELIRFCKENDKLLILDLCFAAFMIANGQPRVDIYEILEDSGVRYIAMEDTGKTWPLQDAKCATVMTSTHINAEFYNIVTSVLLNVSPFVLRLVAQYVQDSGQDDFASVRNLLDHNRERALQALDGGLLKYYEPMVNTSVAWFEITNPDVSADQLQDYLLKHNIYVLPGKYFYWCHPERGQRYIRIALARKPDIFAQAMIAMRSALDSFHVE